MSFERLLSMYCDLTLSQLWDLEKARAGTLQKINGARREMLKDLITKDLQLTDYSLEIIDRAQEIKNGWQPEIHKAHDLDSRRVARLIRKQTEQKWFSSAHVKLLWDLYTRPDQCWKWLYGLYSYDLVSEMLTFKLIAGERKIGAQFTLTEAGWQLIEKFDWASTGKNNVLMDVFSRKEVS